MNCRGKSMSEFEKYNEMGIGAADVEKGKANGKDG
jgi:hypothetical protein